MLRDGICDLCERDMKKVAGCTFTYVRNNKPNTETAKRVRVQAARCEYCHAVEGRLHHADCDEEPCPTCGDRLLRCKCYPNGIVHGMIPGREECK